MVFLPGRVLRLFIFESLPFILLKIHCLFIRIQLAVGLRFEWNRLPLPSGRF
jgi:hypothetical protein